MTKIIKYILIISLDCCVISGRSGRTWEDVTGVTPNQLEMLCCVRFLYYQNKYSTDLLCEFCIGTVANPHDYTRTADHTSMRLVHCMDDPIASKRCTICKIIVYEQLMMAGCDVCIAVREAMYALADVRGDEELNFDAPNSDYGEGSYDGEVRDSTYDADGETTTDFEEEEKEEEEAAEPNDVEKALAILETPHSPMMIQSAQLLLIHESGQEEEIASEISFSQYKLTLTMTFNLFFDISFSLSLYIYFFYACGLHMYFFILCSYIQI